jgi:putative ABC transport system permease protein
VNNVVPKHLSRIKKDGREDHSPIDLTVEEQTAKERVNANRQPLGDAASARQKATEEPYSGTRLREVKQDMRYAVRILYKNPGFATITILTVALGIGANVAIFSVLYSVLWKPLPYHKPEQMVRIWQAARANGLNQLGLTEGQFLKLRQEGQSFNSIGGYVPSNAFVTKDSSAEKVPSVSASAGTLEAMGVQPIFGRTFGVEDETPGGPPVTILTNRFWKRWFASDPNAVGKTININGTLMTVIGILPADFLMPEDFVGNQPIQVLLPRHMNASNPNWNNWNLQPVARLKPDVSAARALAEVSTLLMQSLREHPVGTGTIQQMGYSVRILQLHDDLVGGVRVGMWILAGAVVVVLLIVCANVASLLLARAAVREREIAVRSALGAQRKRIVRQLLTESLIISLLGGAVGLGLAAVGTKMIIRLGADSVPRLAGAYLNIPVLLFSLGICVMAAFLFGLGPATQASRSDLIQSLRDGRGMSIGAAQSRTYRTLVVAEVALAVVLVICAGLLLRSLTHLLQVDAGFKPENVLTAEIDLPDARYPETTQIKAFWEQFLSRVRALPGVTSASETSAPPLTGGSGNTDFDIEGRPADPSMKQHVAMWEVMPDYFSTMSIPLLSGRTLQASDTADVSLSIVINENMAHRYWPNQNPLGQHIRFYWSPTMPNGPGPWVQVVGVAKDVLVSRLTEEAQPEAYMSLAQEQKIINDTFVTSLVVKTASDPSRLIGAIREQVRAIDSEVAVSQVQTGEELVSQTVSQPHFDLVLLGLFAIVALILAAVGVYGILSNMVRQRTREVGIRIALGAQREDIFRLVVGQGMKLAMWGVGFGLAGAVMAAVLMHALLFGVTPFDPFTFLSVIILLLTIAFVACYIPAQRAVGVDPIIALRYE